MFKVTRPDTSIVDWHTRSNGTISNYFEADDGHEFVDLELPSGTLWAAYNFGETYYNEKASVPGKRAEWSNFCYGDPNNHVYYEQPWAKEWSIASVSEWQELIDNCYWKASDTLSLSSGNNYSVYYVFKAKSEEDKGNIKKTSYTTNNTYDENLDPCLRIVKSAYDSDAYYWPQLFVDSSHENDIYPPSNYTPKPPLIDFTNTSSIIRTDWTNTQSTSNYTYHRLVISKNRTLVVTPNGDDSHTGLNALDSNALQTIQGAINKIVEVADAMVADSIDSLSIDWEILVFGDDVSIPDSVTGITEDNFSKIRIYKMNSSTNQKEQIWHVATDGAIPVEGYVKVEGMTVNSTNASVLTILKNRELTINDFYMCDHEVTQKEWKAIMETLPSEMNTHPQGVGDEYPVYYVNWFGAIAYCNKLSSQVGLDCAYTIEGIDNSSYWENFTYPDDVSELTNKTITLNMNAMGYRLPTEVEWEYAARSGKKLENYKYAGGNDYKTVAWLRENSDSSSQPVRTDKISGTDSSNSIGLYDMSGNINEWVWDFYATDLSGADITGPSTATSKRVKKGGGWDSEGEGSNEYAKIDRHSGSTPTETGGSTSSNGNNTYYFGYGFRVVRTAN